MIIFFGYVRTNEHYENNPVPVKTASTVNVSEFLVLRDACTTDGDFNYNGNNIKAVQRLQQSEDYEESFVLSEFQRFVNFIELKLSLSGRRRVSNIATLST